MYDSLDSKDGQNMAIRIAKRKHRESTDVYQVKMIKDENDKVLHEEEEVKERWKIYFEQLMNVENERIEWEVEDRSGEKSFAENEERKSYGTR